MKNIEDELNHLREELEQDFNEELLELEVELKGEYNVKENG